MAAADPRGPLYHPAAAGLRRLLRGGHGGRRSVPPQRVTLGGLANTTLVTFNLLPGNATVKQVARYEEGQISTVPLIHALHNGRAVTGLVLKAVEVIVELFIFVSKGVSWLENHAPEGEEWFGCGEGEVEEAGMPLEGHVKTCTVCARADKSLDTATVAAKSVAVQRRHVGGYEGGGGAGADASTANAHGGGGQKAVRACKNIS